MKEILAIRHVKIEHAGVFEEVFRKKNYQIEYVDTPDNQIIGKNLESYSLILVLGGYMGVYEEERFPYLRYEYQIIEKALKEGIPIVGICLGSQILAKVLGAKVYKGHKKEIGFFDIQKVQDHKYFDNFPTTLKVFQWHGDTFDLPLGAKRVFSSDYYKNQGFVYNNAVGLQFHIEVNQRMITEWLSEYKNEVEEENLNIKSILKDAQVYTMVLKDYVEGFINNIESDMK